MKFFLTILLHVSQLSLFFCEIKHTNNQITLMVCHNSLYFPFSLLQFVKEAGLLMDLIVTFLVHRKCLGTKQRLLLKSQVLYLTCFICCIKRSVVVNETEIIFFKLGRIIQLKLLSLHFEKINGFFMNMYA